MKALPITIAFSSLLLVCFVSLLVSGTIGHKKSAKRGYSFLSEFPFELNEGHDIASQVSRISVYACAASLALSSSSLLWDSDFYPYLTFAIVIAVLGVLKATLFAFLFKIPAYNCKPHILVSVLYFAFNAILCAFEGIFFLNLRSVNEITALILMGIEFALALLLCLLSVNPKLSSWTKMETIGNADGSIDVVRPKPFVLAFSEWLAVFADVLGTLAFVLGIALFELK